MADLDKNAKSLYHNFSIAQLRELALAASIPSERVARLKSKSDFLGAVDAVAGRTRLALLAHRVEALSPYKHCILLEAETPFTYDRVSVACRSAFSDLFKEFLPLDSASQHIEAQLCIDDSTFERVFIKFAHMVEVWVSNKTPTGDLLKTKMRRRHIMVAEINPKNQIVSIAFPGFTQAVEDGERITYHSFASQITELLRDKIALKLDGFKAKVATDILLDEAREEVVDLRRRLRFERGGRMDLDSESDRDAASALAQGLANTGMIVSADAIRTAFRSSEAQSIVLLWRRQEVVTRLSMRYPYPELLFIWDRAEPSLSLIDEIIGKLANSRSFVGPSRLKEARQRISAAGNGEVIRPAWLEQQFAVTHDQALKLLLDSCSLKLCIPVFRFRPDQEHLGVNDWVSSLSEIQRSAHGDKGESLESMSPENIEIAFRRVGV